MNWSPTPLHVFTVAFAVLGVVPSLTSAQNAIPPDGRVTYQKPIETDKETVSPLRTFEDPAVYLFRWVGYMGLMDALGADLRVLKPAQDALARVNAAFVNEDLPAMKSAVDGFLSTEPQPGLRACVLYYYINLATTLPAHDDTATAFDELLPDWDTLQDSLTKWAVNFTYLEQAWQAVAEGNDQAARAYFTRVKETAWTLLNEHPADPLMIWIVEHYLRAAKHESTQDTINALSNLKDLRRQHPDTVLGWACLYEIGYYSSIIEEMPDHSEEYYARMLSEMNDGVLHEALQRDDLVLEAKAMIELFMGHAHFGNDQFDQAAVQYDVVLKKYEQRREWLPRQRGIAHTNPTNYGVRNMAAFSRALANYALTRYDQPDAAIQGFQEFLARYPRAEFADYAIYDMARVQERHGRLANALQSYDRILNEYDYSELVPVVRQKRTAVRQKLLEKGLPAPPAR